MLNPLLFVLSVSLLHTSIALPIWNTAQMYAELHCVNIFRAYLRIDTSKEENLKHAVEFWIRQLTELGIPYAIYKPAGKPILIATVEGTDPTLPSIMLNSHMDVVKADPAEWKYPPFGAHIDDNGNIYGRGTQDTKDVSIQYLEAIRKLKRDNVTLARTIHLTLMPDEEAGGRHGMKAFVVTQEFKALNIGFALDEGLTNTEDAFLATYVDRRPWQMQFVIHGEGGHGFTMPEDSAMAKAHKLIGAVMAFREEQQKIMKIKDNNDFSGYTSVNINIVQGGVAVNVIPTKVLLDVDMRLSTDADVYQIEAMVNSWMTIAGNATEVIYYRKELESAKTDVDDSNPYWVSMRNTINEMGLRVYPVVCPATSDMLVIRNRGIPAIGFSTKKLTISHMHDKDEYQNINTFVRGIEVYTEIIKNLANLPGLKL